MAYPRGRPRLLDPLYADPDVMKKHLPFLRARAQAKFRGESWSLTFDDFQEFWPEDLWANRGKGSQDYCMVMQDLTVGWHRHNIRVITRAEMLRKIKRRKSNVNKIN